MSFMKKTVFVILAAIGFAASVNAQSDYKSAIGVRLGTEYWDLISASLKTFIIPQGALEFNAGFGSRSRYSSNAGTVSASAAYQHHFDIKPVEGFKWFVGGGATIYNSFYKNNNGLHNDYDGFGLALFPTGGVDYKFAKIPLNVSADLRPTFRLAGPSAYNSVYASVGVSARYVFK
jgi:hypothetical protein